MRLYKRPDKDGKPGKIWWCQFAGKRFSTGRTDRKAAEIVAKRIERESADPLHATSKKATLEEAAAAYLKAQFAKSRASGTQSMNARHVGHFVRVFERGANLNTIDAAAVDGYISQRTDEEASPSTIQKELSTLRGMLRVAIRQGHYRRSLDEVMPHGYSREYVPRETSLTLEQVDELCAELTEQRAAHVRFIVATSARWGESERAQPEDVNAEMVFLRGTKTVTSRRLVPRLKNFRTLLVGVKEHMPFQYWGNVRRDLAVACRAAGLPAVTPNDLRRSTGSILRAAGVQPHLIAAVMGHADSRMVERVYGRLTPERLGELIEGTQKVHQGQKWRKQR